MTSEQLNNLPLNGRDFEQLISLAPGVSVVPSTIMQFLTGTPTSPLYGNQNNYSISGYVNGQNAWLYGFELSFQQHLNYLPGGLRGLGISANYSYTASQASLRSKPPRSLLSASATMESAWVAIMMLV